MRFRHSSLAAVVLGLCINFTTPVIALAEIEDEPIDAIAPVVSADSEDPTLTSSDEASTWSLKQRVRRVEQQLANQNQTNLLERINQLQDTVQSLQGKVEEQAHAIKTLKERQENYYKDLDQRINQLESSGGAKPKELNPPKNKQNDAENSGKLIQPAVATKKLATEKSTADQSTIKTAANVDIDDTTASNPPAEEDSYVTAYEYIKARQFDKALPLMKKFIKNYADSRYAAHAHYWIGEISYIQGDMAAAKTEFLTVIKQYPRSTKAADAYVKLGAIYADQGDVVQARKQYTFVQNQFPNSTAAKLAKAKLKTLIN